MPHTYIVFVWHMHQPFYKDLATGEYQLPWTRMHALKDYYGMAKMLDEFPGVRQTFNLVPSMLVQIEEYARGEAQDPFLRCALKPAEELSPNEQQFILKYFFQANPERMIRRYPRYGELYDAWRASAGNLSALLRSLGKGALRDLQVLSQLAWFDEIYQESDPDVRGLVEKGRDYTLEDQALMGRKQVELISEVIPTYRRLAADGQIELSVTPFYHPILPLLCDSDVARVSNPSAVLPRRFRYPDDARYQIEKALRFAEERFGATPVGLWPSEGSVSDEALGLAADSGVLWMATDNGVLGATLKRLAGIEETYQPYLWKQGGREMKMIFRDHFLSDLIGFVYSRMEAGAAAGHFLERVRENCRQLHAQGRDAMVPVILDGENAWEHYDKGGRAFLKELYGMIERDPGISAVTVSEALERVAASELSHVHPGSWINANFNVWIGAEEDNRAWDLLLDARQAYDRAKASDAKPKLTAEQRALAFEELLIAEGSDWCWWYGPEHHSANRAEFDKLFRDHLAHVYRALGLTPPEALSRTLLLAAAPAFQQAPCGMIEPRIDGEISSYFEWMGSGVYSAEGGHSAMHGGESAIREVRYGSDGQRAFFRLDLEQSAPGSMAGSEVRLALESGQVRLELTFALGPDGAKLTGISGAAHPKKLSVQCGYVRLVEVAIDLKSAGISAADTVRAQLSVWRDSLPLDAAPKQGWLEFVPSGPAAWG
jgi:alpha-amylase/alpha-mannosidase (GH57 family)